MRSFSYLKIPLHGLTFKKLDTNEVFYNELDLDLRCYYASKDGIYFDEPIFQDLNNYLLMDNEGNEITLFSYLKQNNYLTNKYVIISTRLNKLLSIQDLDVGSCESFYSLKISSDISHFLNSLNLSNFKVIPNNFNYNLHPSSFYNDIRDDILFFIESNNIVIRELLNKKRIEVIEKEFKKICNYMIENGIYFKFKDTFTFFRYSLKDELDLKISFLDTSGTNKLVINANRTFNMTESEINNLFVNLEYNRKLIEAYYKSYILYIKSIFKFDFCILDLNKYDKNLFTFGYINDFIFKNINEIFNNERN